MLEHVSKLDLQHDGPACTHNHSHELNVLTISSPATTASIRERQFFCTVGRPEFIRKNIQSSSPQICCRLLHDIDSLHSGFDRRVADDTRADHDRDCTLAEVHNEREVAVDKVAEVGKELDSSSD